MATDYRKRGAIAIAASAVVLAGALAGCDAVVPQGGYHKLSHRTRDFAVNITNPPPPPYVASAGGAGAGSVPTLPAGAPAGVTQDMVKNGAHLFGTVCAACHGADGQGTAAAPKLADNEWIWLTPGPTLYEQIVHRIDTGVPQPKQHPGMMPPKGGGNFTDAQVHEIAAYVYALSQQGS